ncbi:hypothetical protein K438DRAFT_1924939 [Mycena galopus ATCC 62051]|nr:hypothetical protein K438DRAFT_1924939 [Mycena galopus ATCC 62051]
MTDKPRAGAGRTRKQSAGQLRTNENRADDAAKTRANKEKAKRGTAKKSQRSSNDAQAAALQDSTNTPAGESALSADQRIALLTARLTSAEAKNQALSHKNHKLKKLARSQAASTDEGIVAIVKPKGKFKIQEAMELSDNRQLFTELQAVVHAVAHEAKIDFKLPWSQQDPGTVAKILRVAGERHGHLSSKRYPRNWATASILQRYINSVRAYRAGKANPASGVSRRRERLTNIGRLEAAGLQRRRESSRHIVATPPPDDDAMNVDSQNGTPEHDHVSRAPLDDSDESENDIDDEPDDISSSGEDSDGEDELSVASD